MNKVSLSSSVFGTLSDGSPVAMVTLTNEAGISAKIISYGAAVQSLMVPDAKGEIADIVIGYDTLDGYEKTPNYTGTTLGRYANRIAGGRFSLDGKTYQLAQNNGPNSLHGGVKGWDKRNWSVSATHTDATSASVTLTYISPDGEEGFPGTVTAEVTYIVNDKNELIVSYKATTDKPTIVNLTNHCLFNFGGIPATRPATDLYIKVEADSITAVDANSIPKHELKVAGTPFDFSAPGLVSDRVKSDHPQIIIGNQGIDHNYMIKGGVTDEPKLAVTAEDKVSGRGMKIFTTEPGLQVYTGNFLDGTIAGKGGQKLVKHQAIAFEAQKYPDSPNQPQFPSARLDPGQTYSQTTIHQFYTIG